MIIVTDASAVVKWYVSEIYTPEAEKLLVGIYEIHAPELMIIEFGSIIWKKVRKKDLTEKEADAIINAFGNQKIVFHSHKRMLKAAFHGAAATGQTVYDWSYLALAISLSCQFVTADEKFYKALENTKLKKHLLWIGDV